MLDRLVATCCDGKIRTLDMSLNGPCNDRSVFTWTNLRMDFLSVCPGSGDS